MWKIYPTRNILYIAEYLKDINISNNKTNKIKCNISVYKKIIKADAEIQ